MPPINIYKCSDCGKVLHEGWGGYQYVINDKGERICCPHPCEDDKIDEVLGITSEELNNQISFKNFYRIFNPSCWWSWIKKKASKEKMLWIKLFGTRTGYNSDCICKNCLKQSELDIGNAEKSKKSWRRFYHASRKRDQRKCPNCGSNEIFTIMELVGKECPFCKKGKIIEEVTGAIS